MASIKLVNSLTDEQVEFMTKILGEIGASLEASGLSFKISQRHPSVDTENNDILDADAVETIFEIDEMSWAALNRRTDLLKAA